MHSIRGSRCLAHRLAPTLALLAPSLAGQAAYAQQPRVADSNGPGLDTHLFRPAVDSKGFFTINGTDVLGHRDISLSFVTDYGHNLMRLQDGHGESALVKHSFQGTFGVNYGLFNRLALGVHVPVNLMVGDSANAVGPTGAEYNADRLNAEAIPFVAAHAKLRLSRNDRILGSALLVQAGVPVSDASRDLGGDPKAWVWPELALHKQFGLIRIGVNGGYRVHSAPGRTVFDQLRGGHFESSGARVTGGAAVSLRALDGLDLVAEIYGTKQVNSSSASAVSLSSEAVGGIKLFIEKNSYFMMGGGTRVGQGFEAADQRAFLGFIFEPSILDRDGDGIPDDQDKCPDEPEDKDGFEDEDGCPDPDNDKDGIPDKDDRCPNEAETYNGFQDEDGCPDQIAEGLRDRDGDGIPDKFDRCPDEPEDKDGFEDEDGCPDPDNDKDGIPDTRDQCPNNPETYNGFQDEDGCPDQRNVIVQENNILILDKILFERGSAKILPQSNDILDAVAATIKDHPEFDLVEIQGHADERGDIPLNLRLTNARSQAVVDALIERGVDRKQVRAKGYGKFCPLDPDHTEEAWEKNRRVEFKVVKASGKPTDVELGCEEARSHGVVPEPVH